MWEFIKHSPVTFGIAGAIMVVAVVATILGIVYSGFREDRELLEREGKHLRWVAGELPLIVLGHPDLAMSWHWVYQAAAMEFNTTVGIPLFDPNLHPTPEGYNLDQEPPRGFVMLQPHWDQDADSVATTEHRYDRQTGKLMSTTVTVPVSVVKLSAPAMLHELGHVLGLAHDEHPSSIMYPTLTSRTKPGTLSKGDIELLRRLYG